MRFTTATKCDVPCALCSGTQVDPEPAYHDFGDGPQAQPQPCRLCVIKPDRPDEAHDCVYGPLADSQDLRDARFAIGALIAAAGGRVVVMPSVLVNLDPGSEIETYDDPVSGARIFSLRSTRGA